MKIGVADDLQVANLSALIFFNVNAYLTDRWINEENLEILRSLTTFWTLTPFHSIWDFVLNRSFS